MQEIFHLLLEQTVDRSGYSVPEISDMVGRERTWLYRLLNRSRPVRIEHIEEVYAALGIPIAEFFVACLQKLNSPFLVAKSDLAANPAALLRILRGDAEPDLGWLEQFRSCRISKPDSAESHRLHRSVRRIDDAREFDRQAALVDSEKWLRSFERRCRRRRLSAQETSHLATALGVWASIQRACGHQALGLKALELAWELHGENPWIASSGDLLERSSMAVYEHGYPLLAAPLMQRAFAIAAFHRNLHHEAKAFLGLGILAFRSGNLQGAREAFEQVLEHPGADRFRLTGASSLLAIGYEQEGKLAEAYKCLDRLSPIVPTLPARMQHSLLGIRARLQRNSGDLLTAKSTYQRLYLEAIPLFRAQDRAAILLELATILVELEDVAALRNLSGHVARLLNELEQTPFARTLMAELLSTIRRGEEITLDRIHKLQAALSVEREAPSAVD